MQEFTDHVFNLTLDGSASCSCGEEFVGDFDGDFVVTMDLWLGHAEIQSTMDWLAEVSRREREARLQTEQAIVRLDELGISSRAIATVIGQDRSGKDYVSPTTVLRIAKGTNQKTPRRRRKPSN